MLNRRNFLKRSSLVALATGLPEFLLRTASAAEPGKETILVLIELTGGNDGLNTLIPYADDLYQKARPTLGFRKDQVIRLNDYVGLHPGMHGLDRLISDGQVAIVQGVGYPNPNRSHFESMDAWQSGDPERRPLDGWIARSLNTPHWRIGGDFAAMQVGSERLPLALQGASGNVVSVQPNRQDQFVAGNPVTFTSAPQRKLMHELSKSAVAKDEGSLLDFVRRRHVQTYDTIDRLQAAIGEPQPSRNAHFGEGAFAHQLSLISRLIAKDFGTRVFYLSLSGFDTHADQVQTQAGLLEQLATGLGTFFEELRTAGHDKRVLAMTFSEFGRRVQENGSHGTDHGAASCLFVVGPAVKGGPIGTHPSLKDLDAGDLRYTVDFRQVYATILDQWLACDSKAVLKGSFTPINLLKAKS
jgi:uncharacterized protein (DUF1501 family)